MAKNTNFTITLKKTGGGGTRLFLVLMSRLLCSGLTAQCATGAGLLSDCSVVFDLGAVLAASRGHRAPWPLARSVFGELKFTLVV